MRPCSSKLPPQDLRAVGREERPAVVAGRRRQTALAGAVGLHDVDLAEPARVGGELLLLDVAERVVVGGARRREHDPLSVRGVAGFGVVAADVGEPGQRLGLLGVGVDLHLGVVVPGVAALLARGAKRELVVLILLRLRIVVRRGEQNLVGAGAEEAARRLAQAGRDAGGVAGREVHHVHLIERIAGLPLALQHEPLAVRRPVAFAGPPPLDREPAHARQEVALLVGGRRLGGKSGGQHGNRKPKGEREWSQHPAILPSYAPSSPSGGDTCW